MYLKPVSSLVSKRGTNYDTLDLSGLTNPVIVVFTAPGAGLVTDTVTGHTVTFSEIEQLILTQQADVVDASLNNGYTYIQSLGGNDQITPISTSASKPAIAQSDTRNPS